MKLGAGSGFASLCGGSERTVREVAMGNGIEKGLRYYSPHTPAHRFQEKHLLADGLEVEN